LIRRLLFILLAAALGAAVLLWATLPDVRPLATNWPRTTSFMERRKADLARHGETARLEWTPVPLSRISPELQRAVVVAEDARFFEHDGVDWEAMRGAMEKNWEKGGLKVGGSTITQQLAKNLYLSPARTPWRKLREVLIARRLEAGLPKKRILELYLNVIEFGRRTFGAEAAARRYFGESAKDLSREQAATLAAIIPSPRIYDPKKHPERVKRRAERILRGM
jgi:monofunctional biosynthetic peptidoglycan transglycosylase